MSKRRLIAFIAFSCFVQGGRETSAGAVVEQRSFCLLFSCRCSPFLPLLSSFTPDKVAKASRKSV